MKEMTESGLSCSPSGRCIYHLVSESSKESRNRTSAVRLSKGDLWRIAAMFDKVESKGKARSRPKEHDDVPSLLSDGSTQPIARTRQQKLWYQKAAWEQSYRETWQAEC